MCKSILTDLIQRLQTFNFLLKIVGNFKYLYVFESGKNALQNKYIQSKTTSALDAQICQKKQQKKIDRGRFGRVLRYHVVRVPYHSASQRRVIRNQRELFTRPLDDASRTISFEEELRCNSPRGSGSALSIEGARNLLNAHWCQGHIGLTRGSTVGALASNSCLRILSLFRAVRILTLPTSTWMAM